MNFYFLIKWLFLNLLFIILITGTTYVFFSKRINENKKQKLIYTKFLLFSIFLLLRYSKKVEQIDNPNRFINLIPNQKNLDFIFDNSNFKFKVKNNNKKVLCLKNDLQRKKGLKIYFNENIEELKFLIENLVKKSSLEIINLKYLQKEEDWVNNHANILQHLKMEILNLKQNSEKIFILQNLNLELLKHDFLDLLIMFSNYFENSRFFILENDKKNIKFIRRKYKYLNIFEIEEIEPEVFKSSIIHIILNSPQNHLSDVQAARIAHDYYKDNGANLTDLFKVYEDYN